MSKKSKARNKRRRAEAAEQGFPKRCHSACRCSCHQTGGGIHEHYGQPCPGRAYPIFAKRMSLAEIQQQYPPTNKETH